MCNYEISSKFKIQKIKRKCCESGKIFKFLPRITFGNFRIKTSNFNTKKKKLHQPNENLKIFFYSRRLTTMHQLAYMSATQ